MQFIYLSSIIKMYKNGLPTFNLLQIAVNIENQNHIP